MEIKKLFCRKARGLIMCDWCETLFPHCEYCNKKFKANQPFLHENERSSFEGEKGSREEPTGIHFCNYKCRKNYYKKRGNEK